MSRSTTTTIGYGGWIMAAASAAGLVLSIASYLRIGSGIDHTYGALLVTVSTALLSGAAVIVALLGSAGWPSRILQILILLGILGTALAAYFLEAHALLALMAVALLGWLAHLFLDPTQKVGERGPARVGVPS